MQSMFIIIVLVFCVNGMAKNVIVNQTEYKWRCYNASLRKAENFRVMWGVVKVKRYQSHRNSIDLLKILQHKRKVQTKQVSYLHQKLKGNEFLEQVALSLQWDVYNSSRVKHAKKYLKYWRFFSCNFPYSEYQGIIHRGNWTKTKLCNDI